MAAADSGASSSGTKKALAPRRAKGKFAEPNPILSFGVVAVKNLGLVLT
jgi:hypothetical protein